MIKQKIAKALIIVILLVSTLVFLPWFYKTPVYYMARYAIMAMTACELVLTFSFKHCFSARFIRLILLTILLMSVLILFIPILKSDIMQLVIAMITVMIGMGLEWEDIDWAEISYYYTLLMVVVTICNCFFYAGGLYVPEHYMFDEGKNQVGAMVAIGAAACFYFGMKFKENRVAFSVVSFLALLCVVLIRARAACFALLAVGILIVIKESDIHIKWNLKTVLTIIAILFIGYIIYNGFISDELHRFMFGGKDAQNMDDVTSNRWARNQRGLEMLAQGNSVDENLNSTKIPYIHNYPLLRLVRYGIFSIPLLAFYAYFGISALVEIFKTRKSQTKQAGWVVCCVPLLISFFEPNFPYGPGLVQMLAFLLLGFSLRPDDLNQNQIPEYYVKAYDKCKNVLCKTHKNNAA